MSDEGGAVSLPPEWVSACFANLEHGTQATGCFNSWRQEGLDERQLEESPALRGLPQRRPRSSEVTTADQRLTEEWEQTP